MKKVLVLLLMIALLSSVFVTGCQKQNQVEEEKEQVEEIAEQNEAKPELEVANPETEKAKQ